jgi:hypothetical protein
MIPTGKISPYAFELAVEIHNCKNKEDGAAIVQALITEKEYYKDLAEEQGERIKRLKTTLEVIQDYFESKDNR